MDKTPITFDHEGKQYSGYFNKVSGSGNTALFHLMINNYYQGQLFNSDNYGWQFHGKDGTFSTLAVYFGEYVTASE